MNTKRPRNNHKKSPRRSHSTRERVRTFLGLFGQKEDVLILINPDPDSMASALAVRRLLWKHVHRTVIAYIGEIQRLENLAMMELLKIPMVKIGELVPQDFPRHILVDSQPHHSKIFEQFTYDAIIDHHPLGKRLNARYMDIRPEYGATSTILIEYLRAAGIKPSMKLATALLYGIKTDTANFERDVTEEDVKQFRYVFRYANLIRLRKIEKSELRLRDLKYFQAALGNRIVGRKGIYTHLGEVPSADICVHLADFFMRVYGVHWSFVSGVYRERLIVIIRNDGFRKDAGRLAVRAFGAFGSAGGHRGAARAEIAVEFLRQKGMEINDSILGRFVRKRLSF
jgi:nanoRNase/pAp phosphatase (c-di-AMP/oligoRNAs hydrolase)